jgi:hypothetical protein
MYLIITLLTNFIWLASVIILTLIKFQKTLNYLETNIHVYLEKKSKINFKTVNTSAESLSDKTDLKIYWLIEFYFTGISIWINIRWKK